MIRYRVPPNTKIDLDKWDPNDKQAFDREKEEGRSRLLQLNRELESLQELLYAENKNKFLVVLQGMDTSGKDGTIRHVFEGVNPQGVKVTSFGKPTTEELSHDYLWRIHKCTPARGQIVIFNRSHYEDLLVVRVRKLTPSEVWQRRYRHINEFERMLTDEGTTILKFYLHIDLTEQKERFQARLDDPAKHWKFNPSDLVDRKLWPDFMEAYEDVLSQTSTEWAPWYIVPSNRKWYRNLVVASVIVDKLKALDMAYPKPEKDFGKIVIE